MPASDNALVFTVAGARLGLRVRHVVEVVPIAALTRAPEMPQVVEGFLSLAGSLIPVVRLHQLLRLDLGVAGEWRPKENLSSRIVIAKVSHGLLGWFAGEGAGLVPFKDSGLVRLPPGHVLNNCAEYVIARTPPEPSIVLLEPDRVLLEKERTCIEEIRTRMEERMSSFSTTGE